MDKVTFVGSEERSERRSTENADGGFADKGVDVGRSRYPYCVVWTPLPLLTWVFPFIGHMGICTSSGVIRDFAAPYFVSEDNMAFGKPTKYWQLKAPRSEAGRRDWDNAVHQASEVYGGRMHNLCCDNCHSHVAMALNLMMYDNSTSWNMVKLAFYLLLYGKYTGVGGFLKTWLPFGILFGVVLALVFVTRS